MLCGKTFHLEHMGNRCYKHILDKLQLSACLAYMMSSLLIAFISSHRPAELRIKLLLLPLNPCCQAFVLNPGNQNQLSTDIRWLGKMLTLLRNSALAERLRGWTWLFTSYSNVITSGHQHAAWGEQSACQQDPWHLPKSLLYRILNHQN